jgi:chromate transporter
VDEDAAMSSALTAIDLLGLLGHFMLLSLLAVGGAITAASDMQRYLVAEHGWIADAQFTASDAIAQAAPGPNVLFVAVLGWNVAGAAGMVAALVGILLPSSLLTLSVTRWTAQRRETRGVRAFTTGMAPLTLGLLLATGWVLAEPFVRDPAYRPWTLALVAVTIVVMQRSRLSPMWLVALGAVVGAFAMT